MFQTRLSVLIPLCFLLVLGFSLHADAYRTSGIEAYPMNKAAYGPDYCPCSPPAQEALSQPLSEPSPEHVALTQNEPALPEPLYYKVNAGDTLNKIARDFDVSLPSLMALNNLSEAHWLSVGQQLQIPYEEAAIPLPGGQVKIKQVLNSTLTAYTAGVESTGKTAASPLYGITYSGSKAAEGRTIAVDPSVIPIGSLVYIDGVGIRTAEDTGSAVRGARIDVFMEDVEEALDFGVKPNVKVYVLSADNV